MIKQIVQNNRNLVIATMFLFVIFLYSLVGYSMIKF